MGRAAGASDIKTNVCATHYESPVATVSALLTVGLSQARYPTGKVT